MARSRHCTNQAQLRRCCIALVLSVLALARSPAAEGRPNNKNKRNENAGLAYYSAMARGTSTKSIAAIATHPHSLPLLSSSPPLSPPAGYRIYLLTTFSPSVHPSTLHHYYHDTTSPLSLPLMPLLFPPRPTSSLPTLPYTFPHTHLPPFPTRPFYPSALLPSPPGPSTPPPFSLPSPSSVPPNAPPPRTSIQFQLTVGGSWNPPYNVTLYRNPSMLPSAPAGKDTAVELQTLAGNGGTVGRFGREVREGGRAGR
ncbi:unnamed protein product [Closterium sp. NIES-64]|nr:unnamed protein product [Closterium sp. NIES-64]